MAVADLTMKKNDTPAYVVTVIDPATGVAANLTGATVTFVMRPMTALAPTTNAAATVTTPASGVVTYNFTAGDTLNAGIFAAEFHITLTSGVKYTWPTTGYLEVSIEEDLITPGGSRLVGIGEVRDYLGIQTTDKVRDAKLLRFIDAATPVIENITGPIVVKTYTNEQHDGGTWFIEVRHRPIVSVASVTEWRANIAYPLTQVATPDLGTIYSYQWEPTGRIVRRTVGGGQTPFPVGSNAVAVTYNAGYITPPANVVQGVLELLRANFQATQQGRPKSGGGDVDGALDHVINQGFFVPWRVQELLSPNKRHPSIA